MAEPYRLTQQGQQVQTAIDKALALGPATSSSAGTMSAADKSKLDSMNPSNYQPVLVSGTNIKTVNGQTILGPGNIDAGSSVTIDAALSSTSTNPVQNKVINAALAGKQATLVGSGTGQNIKTINNQNILGSGDITVGDQNAVKFTVQTLTTSQKTQARTNIGALSSSDLSNLAPKASPAFTGTPTAPTATAGTNTTQIATTAFVTNALSSKADSNAVCFLGDVIETI